MSKMAYSCGLQLMPAADCELSWLVSWNVYIWPLHVAWASWLGGWVLRESITGTSIQETCHLRSSRLRMTFLWKPQNVISTAFYQSHQSVRPVQIQRRRIRL